EVVGEDRLLEPDPVVHPQRGRGELDVPGLVVEPHLDLLVGRADPAEPVDEVHVPGRAAELPVGGRPQPRLALHAHDVADRGVLDRGEPGGVDAALRVVLPRGEELGRTQQAADVVGPERRRGSHGQGLLLLRGEIRTLPLEALPRPRSTICRRWVRPPPFPAPSGPARPPSRGPARAGLSAHARLTPGSLPALSAASLPADSMRASSPTSSTTAATASATAVAADTGRTMTVKSSIWPASFIRRKSQPLMVSSPTLASKSRAWSRPSLISRT